MDLTQDGAINAAQENLNILREYQDVPTNPQPNQSQLPGIGSIGIYVIFSLLISISVIYILKLRKKITN